MEYKAVYAKKKIVDVEEDNVYAAISKAELECPDGYELLEIFKSGNEDLKIKIKAYNE